MKNLSAHACNYLDVFDSIANSKRGPRRQFLNLFRPALVNRYLSYEQNLGALHNLTTITTNSDTKDALLHCYEGSSKSLSKLKSEIRKSQPPAIAHKCQYCGVDSSPTYDHYLPKDIFPEFAVLAINLVPCCYSCNEKKKTRWRNVNACLFFHLYFDQLPAERVLHCNIVYTQGVPTAEFYLDRHPNVPQNLFDRATSHYSELNLFTKFSESSNGIISEIYNELKQYQNLTETAIASLIQAKANGLVQTFGPNYWQVAICEGLLRSQRFLDSCINA